MTYTGINDILKAFFTKLKSWLQTNITKSYVGLGNCDNTADKDKNVNSAQYVSRSNNTFGVSSNTLVHFEGTTDAYTQSAELTNGDDLEIRNTLIDVNSTKETWYGNTTKLMTLQPTGTWDTITGADLTLHNGTITANKFSGELNGNATTATKLATARSISITDGTNTGTASSFDGNSNISLQLPSAYNGFIQNKWNRTNCVELGYSKGENITDLAGFFTNLYNRYGQYINLYFDWADACCANLVVNNTTIILNDTLFFGKIQEMQGGWQSSNIFISSFSSNARYNLLLNCLGTTTIQATLKKLITDDTDNTFSATNNFSGTLVIPTTSSTTNGAIWIG